MKHSPDFAIARLRRRPLVDRLNTRSRVLFASKRNVDANRLVRRMRHILTLTNHNLDDLPVLPEILLIPQQLSHAITLDLRAHARHVDEIPLADAQTGEVLAAEVVGFALLGFLLLCCGALLLLGGLVLFVLQELFLRDVLEGVGLVVVGSSAGRTQPVHRRLDVVVAELAYLGRELVRSHLVEVTVQSVPGRSRVK